MPWISNRALAELRARADRCVARAELAEDDARRMAGANGRLAVRVETASRDARTEAAQLIEAAIVRIRTEHPDEPAMQARILGMRAAQRIVASPPNHTN